MLCFVYVTRTSVVTKQYFSYSWAVLIQHQGHFYFSHCIHSEECAGGKEFGREYSQASWPQLTPAWGGVNKQLHRAELPAGVNHNVQGVRRQLITVYAVNLRFLAAVWMSPNSSIFVNLQIHPDILLFCLFSILTHAGSSKTVGLQFKRNFEKHQGHPVLFQFFTFGMPSQLLLKYAEQNHQQTHTSL